MELPMPNCNFTEEEFGCIKSLARKLDLSVTQRGEVGHLWSIMFVSIVILTAATTHLT